MGHEGCQAANSKSTPRSAKSRRPKPLSPIYSDTTRLNWTSIYGLEVCPLTVSYSRALDFVVNRFFVEVFTTNVMDTVRICQEYFNFDLPSSIIEKRRKTFVARSRQLLVKLVKI